MKKFQALSILLASFGFSAGSAHAEEGGSGLLAEGAEADSWANGLTLFYAPEWGVINDRWNYAMSATIPYVSMDVTANVSTGGGAMVRRNSKVDGVGDIILQPLVLNQNVSEDFHVNYRVNLYAPTGSYEVGRPNLGSVWSETLHPLRVKG